MIARLVAVLTVLAGWPAASPPYWIDQLGLTQAWSVSDGTGVTVGLVDTGVDSGDPALAGVVTAGAEFPDLGAGSADARGHGTTMALLIAGQGHSGGTPGVAPGAKILAARLDGGAADTNDAIRWVVDHGASVVNLSLGSAAGRSDAYDDGLRYAREHDVVIVAAAGNVATDTGVTSPADRDGVIAVSAVDRTGRFRPDVSVQGDRVDLAAPGVDMATSRRGEARATSGTSQAAAIVSGVAALVRSRYPDLSAAEVARRLTTTATDAGAEGKDPRYGFGVVNPVGALATGHTPRPSPRWMVAGGILLAVGGFVALRLVLRPLRRR